MIKNGCWQPSVDIARAMLARCEQKIGRDLVDGSLWLHDLVRANHRRCERTRFHEGRCPDFLDDMLDPFLTSYALTCIAQREQSRGVTDRKAENHTQGLVNPMLEDLSEHCECEPGDVTKVIVAAYQLTFSIVGQTDQALTLTYCDFGVPYYKLIRKIISEC
jgi:hypothetical protein